MASFADLRPIIVIVCFLSVFLFFTTEMAASPAIWNTTETQRINADEGFSGMSLLSWNMTNGTILNHVDGWTCTAKLNGKDIKIYSWYSALPPSPIVQIDTFDVVGGGFPINYQTNFDHLKWYNDSAKNNQVSEDQLVLVPAPHTNHGLPISLLDSMWTAGSGLSFTISNSRLTSTVAFSFNDTLYALPSNAFAADALAISFNLTFEENNSGMNAFQLITGLLFWSLPGVPVEIYVLFSFVLWPPIIYVLAIWVLRIIGSVFGGGGGG